MKRPLTQRIFQKFNSSILEKVLFIGGRSRFPSVRVRCLEVAEAIGCDHVTDINSIDDIPAGKEIFICVKPLFDSEALEKLHQRGIVIWDIHDNYCPRNFIDYYLVSSKGGYEKFHSYGKTYIIPHHHCNFSGFPNPKRVRGKPVWMGSPEWIPQDLNFPIEIYNSKELTTEEIVQVYQNSTILLNLRASFSVTSESVSEHVRINPGLKLINSIGFAVPSISNREPAYWEIGPECTIFVEDNNDCQKWLERLHEDNDLYDRLRNNCIFKAPDYSISNIAKQYLELIVSKI